MSVFLNYEIKFLELLTRPDPTRGSTRAVDIYATQSNSLVGPLCAVSKQNDVEVRVMRRHQRGPHVLSKYSTIKE